MMHRAAAPPDYWALEEWTAQLERSVTAIERLYAPLSTPPARSTVAGLVEEFEELLLPGFFADEPGSSYRDIIARAARSLEALIISCAAVNGNDGINVMYTRNTFMDRLPALRSRIGLDVAALLEADPACRHAVDAIRASAGFHAILVHRLAHELLVLGVPLLPRMMAFEAQMRTGIDIHPAAHIGPAFVIDHGTGVVIGETTQIGDHCRLYQGVTLGARSVTRDMIPSPRHPTLEDHVTVYAGATILGGNTIIGAGSVIGAGVYITSSIAPGTVVRQASPELLQRENRATVPGQYQI